MGLNWYFSPFSLVIQTLSTLCKDAKSETCLYVWSERLQLVQNRAAICISPKNQDSLEGYQMFTYIEIDEQTHTFFPIWHFGCWHFRCRSGLLLSPHLSLWPCRQFSQERGVLCPSPRWEELSLLLGCISKSGCGRVVPSTPQSKKYPTTKLPQEFWQESKVPTFVLSN